MSVGADLAAAVGDALSTSVLDGQRVSGGSLNDAWRLELADGRSAFVKTSAEALPGSYAAEARGLAWLGEAGGLPVPEVLAVLDGDEADAPDPRLLALEWIDAGRLGRDGEETLGRELATIHAAGAAHFGSENALVVGSLELPAGPAASWPELYAQARLLPAARIAADAGRLDAAGLAAVERVCARLPELAGEPEPPARLHGDLWTGNVLPSARGVPYLVDPAAHGGHREVDLAMLRLFGAPSQRCFDAYADAFPLAQGHAERVGLWQLFPLLVHAALFGGGYGASAAATAARYA